MPREALSSNSSITKKEERKEIEMDRARGQNLVPCEKEL
jgi:hypothetical protein